ncbi:MAG TPA: pitrilysin family protein [Gammaproteobacteria bacterium]|nr:pitrilysin family protein [Gammaproteobacteria bacterium]
MSSAIRLSPVNFAALALTVGMIGYVTDALPQTSRESSGAASGAPQLNLEYERFTLPNGLTVIVHEDRKAPVVAVSIWYHVGSKNEPAGKTGFAHLFEHLMFNGSENYDGEWFEPMQQVGATGMNGTTWLDRTNYFQTVPTPALDLALWMESDRMGHLLGAVSQEKLDNQRGVVQNEKRQGDNEPYGRVNYNLYEGLFPPGHPYRHSTIGSMEDLNAASLDDVLQWFRDYYGPNNAVLSLAGDIDTATAREKVERYFGDIPAGPEVDRFETWIPQRTLNTHEIQYDEVPAVLANRGWVAPGWSTRERALLDLAAAALGQGKNSRLYLDLIYNRQLASSVNIGVTAFELASVVDLSVRLNPGEDASVATEAIDRIVAEFLVTGPTEEELDRAVTGINAGTVRGLEQVGGFGGKAVILAEGQLYAGNPVFIEQYLEWINSATPAEVRDVARTYLTRGWHQVDVVPRGSHTAAPAGVDRSTGLPPIPTDLPTLSFPQIHTATLSNGVQVVLAERHAVPVVEMSMQFDAGYAADAGRKLGVASFAMSMLDEGTRSRTALEIAAEGERLGANVSAGSNLDASSVSLSAIKSELADSINLWSDMIQNPAFDPEEIERQRRQRIAGIAQEKAEPVALALRLLPPVIYGPGHAYGVPFTGSGTEQSIASITRDDLVAFKNSWLRPDNARLFIAGDTTIAEITPLLERAFREWRAPNAPLLEKNIADVELPSSPRVILIDKPGSPQSFILAGHVIPGLGSERDLAIDAMNGVLGGTFTARINMNLREEKGWAYGARTQLQGARGPRPMLVYAPVQTDRTGDSVAELIRELTTIKTSRPIAPNEMSRVIAGSTRELPGQFETAGAVLGSLITSARYGRPLDYAATLTERYEALSLSDLQSAASDLVQPASLIWVIVGDLSQIRSQVEALNIAPVEIWNDDGQPVE